MAREAAFRVALLRAAVEDSLEQAADYEEAAAACEQVDWDEAARELRAMRDQELLRAQVCDYNAQALLGEKPAPR